jgi:polyisoprenoid-binding protein YceI
MKLHWLVGMASAVLLASCGDKKAGGESEAFAADSARMVDSLKKVEMEAAAAMVIPDAVSIDGLKIDVSKSMIEWTGYKLTGKHNGAMKFKDGVFVLVDDAIQTGEFIIDLSSVEVMDLKGEDKGKLETHLKTGEFFETEKYPNGRFVITSVKPKKDGMYTHMVEGTLTMRGKENPVSFPAKVEIGKGGKSVTAETMTFKLDRTQWGIVYNGMADNAIKNEVDVKIKLMTK